MALQQLSGKQIRPGVIEDKHISGMLSESVLNINWADPDHAQDILRNKIISDYVQYTSPITIQNSSSDVDVVFSLDDSATSVPGVIVGGFLRFRTETGDIIVSDGKEVKAKIDSKVGPTTDGFIYKVKFYESDGVTPYIFSEEASLDFLYPVKTTLWDAVENFASNERYVDGAVDVMSKMKIAQIVADIFGDGYAFTGNGTASLSETISDKIDRLTKGTVNTGITAPEIIDEVVKARGTFDDLDARIKEAEDNIEFINDHVHGKDVYALTSEKAEFIVGTELANVSVPIKETDDYDLYVNGQLQEEVLHYTVRVNAGVVEAFVFGEVLVPGDVVSLRFTAYR